MTRKLVVVVMGVSGAGKTTVGRLLAEALGVPFVDGDDLHDPEHLERMARGEPLGEADRIPWLERCNRQLRAHRATGVVLACSALTREARGRLLDGVPDARLVALVGDASLIEHRLAARPGHPVGPALLPSQLAALDVPEHAVVVPVAGTPGDVAARALAALSELS